MDIALDQDVRETSPDQFRDSKLTLGGTWAVMMAGTRHVPHLSAGEPVGKRVRKSGTGGWT